MIPRHLHDDRTALAEAILEGARRRPQCFGEYFCDDGGSCAMGAAYESLYLVPRTVGHLHPTFDLDRFFDCLEYIVRSCPEGCRKRLPLGPMILHLNDDHHWTRERIADWVKTTA
ncbi:MAG: hypothetical protein KGN76_11430 [Acidobacteriota bacterium]|nr:hypothetical protein [Acidobacteriota bacterium]